MAKALLAVAATAAVGVAAFVFTVVSKQSSQPEQSRKGLSSEELRKDVGKDLSSEESPNESEKLQRLVDCERAPESQSKQGPEDKEGRDSPIKAATDLEAEAALVERSTPIEDAAETPSKGVASAKVEEQELTQKSEVSAQTTDRTQKAKVGEKEQKKDKSENSSKGVDLEQSTKVEEQQRSQQSQSSAKDVDALQSAKEGKEEQKTDKSEKSSKGTDIAQKAKVEEQEQSTKSSEHSSKGADILQSAKVEEQKLSQKSETTSKGIDIVQSAKVEQQKASQKSEDSSKVTDNVQKAKGEEQKATQKCEDSSKVTDNVQKAKVEEQEATQKSEDSSKGTDRGQKAKVEKQGQTEKTEVPSAQEAISGTAQKADESLPRKGSGMAELVDKKVPTSSRAPETRTVSETQSLGSSASVSASPPKAQAQAPANALNTGGQQAASPPNEVSAPSRIPTAPSKTASSASDKPQIETSKQVQKGETKAAEEKDANPPKSSPLPVPASKEPLKQEISKATSPPAKSAPAPPKAEAASESDRKHSAEKRATSPPAKSATPPPKVEAASAGDKKPPAEKQVAPQAWGNAASTVSKIQDGAPKSLIPQPKKEPTPPQEEASNNGAANKRSFASLTKPSANPPTQRTASPSVGSYADMAKPVGAKTSTTSPPDDRSRFGFVAKLPKLATSPPSSRSQSVANMPKPAEVQVGFEPAKPPSRPLSPSAPPFIPGQKSAEAKPEEGQKVAAEDKQAANGSAVKAEEKNGVVTAKAFFEKKRESQTETPESQPPGKASPTKAPVKPTINVADLPATIPGSVSSTPSDGSHSPKDDVTSGGEQSNGVTPVGSPSGQKAYVEAVVWNADKTRKNKAKRDKKKAKKSRSTATSPTREGPEAK